MESTRDWHSQMQVSFSRVWLFAAPQTIALQAPLSLGFSRQESWSGLSFPSPGDLLDPGIEPGSPALQMDSLPSEPPGKPQLGMKQVLRDKRDEMKIRISSSYSSSSFSRSSYSRSMSGETGRAGKAKHNSPNTRRRLTKASDDRMPLLIKMEGEGLLVTWSLISDNDTGVGVKRWDSSLV